jgi:protein O-mannosyl-transferase
MKSRVLKTSNDSSRSRRQRLPADKHRVDSRRSRNSRSDNRRFLAVPSGYLIPALIFIMTVVTFLPSLRNEFVNWDDYKTLVENKNYRGLGWEHIHWMFTTLHMGHYQPLSWVTFGLDYLVWGMNPVGYHLTNLLLHAVNAALFYFIAFRLFLLADGTPSVSFQTTVPIAAGFAALFFAIHPLRVESVVWATERRDVLSGLFFLLTILSYLKANATAEVDNHRRRWLMLGTFVFYFCALLSKAITVIIPVVMLILDVYPLKRLGLPVTWAQAEFRRVWWEKVSFFLLGIIFGINAIFAQRDAGLKSMASYDLLARIAQAAFGSVFYIWKTVFPFGLSPLYELPVQLNPADWPFVLSTLVVVAISVCLFIARTVWPAGMALWLYYWVVVLPMLGLTQSGPQIVADRYSYLSCLGWAMLAAVPVRYFLGTGIEVRVKDNRVIVACGAAIVVLVVLGSLTWKQIPVWRNTESLWRHAIAVGHGSSTVHYNLAYALHKQGNLGGAIQHYRESLSFNPNAADAHYYLADALAQQGSLNEALKHYRRAIDIRPNFWGAYYNWAIVLEQQGNLDEATKRYREALQINPSNASIHKNLAIALLKNRAGDHDEAIAHLRHSLKLDPQQSAVYFILGNVLAARGLLDEAAENFQAAVQLKPTFTAAYLNLGRVLAAQGQLDSAITSFRKALAIDPESAEVRSSLAQALEEKNQKIRR